MGVGEEINRGIPTSKCVSPRWESGTGRRICRNPCGAVGETQIEPELALMGAYERSAEKRKRYGLPGTLRGTRRWTPINESPGLPPLPRGFCPNSSRRRGVRNLHSGHLYALCRPAGEILSSFLTKESGRLRTRHPPLRRTDSSFLGRRCAREGPGKERSPLDGPSPTGFARLLFRGGEDEVVFHN